MTRRFIESEALTPRVRTSILVLVSPAAGTTERSACGLIFHPGCALSGWSPCPRPSRRMAPRGWSGRWNAVRMRRGRWSRPGRLLMSQWYQRNWAQSFSLTADQNVKQRFENDKRGYRLATSVGGQLTGEGGDYIIADDPHNVKDAESDAVRTGTLEWWDKAMSTRLNNPKTGHKIIVMQRVHQDDLAGHVVEQGGYYHLCLPARFRRERTFRRDGGRRRPF